MAIESLSSDFKFHPNLKFFLVGFVYFSIAMFLAIYTFYEYAGIVSIILCAFAAFPYFYRKIKSEELYDEKVESEEKKLKKHSTLIMLFMMFFLGVVIASTFWNVMLPGSYSDDVFRIQLQEIDEINDNQYIIESSGNTVSDATNNMSGDVLV